MQGFESRLARIPSPSLLLFALLAGAILVEGSASILLHTIEPYGRDSSIDAHHERRLPGSPSSFPERQGPYGFLNICLLPTPDGQKLVLGSRSCNLLVTSSLRLDTHSVNIGHLTTHFTPSPQTRAFLDSHSVELTKRMLANESTNSAKTMPVLYQLRQVRSKFHSLSTYTKCRASSTFTSRLELTAFDHMDPV